MWWILCAALAAEEAWVPVEPLVTTGAPWRPGAAAAQDASPWAVLPDGAVLAQVTDEAGELHLARCHPECVELGTSGVPDDNPEALVPVAAPPALAGVVHPDGSHLLLADAWRGPERVGGVWRYQGDTFVWMGTVAPSADGVPKAFGRAALAADGTFARVDLDGVLWFEDPDGVVRRVAGPGDTLPGTSEPIDWLMVEGVAPGVVVWLGVGATASSIVRSDASADAPVDTLVHAAIDWVWSGVMGVTPAGSVVWSEERNGDPSWSQILQDGEAIATSRQPLGAVEDGWRPFFAAFPAQTGINLVVDTPIEGDWRTTTWVEEHLVVAEGTSWRTRLSGRGPTDLGRGGGRWDTVFLTQAVFDARGQAAFPCQHIDNLGPRAGACVLDADDRAAFLALGGEPLQLDGEPATAVYNAVTEQRLVIGGDGRVATTVALADGRSMLVTGAVADVEVRQEEEDAWRDHAGCDTARGRGAWAVLAATSVLLRRRGRAGASRP